jgi:hypothetical protein
MIKVVFGGIEEDYRITGCCLSLKMKYLQRSFNEFFLKTAAQVFAKFQSR